jgi:hypothetical protein
VVVLMVGRFERVREQVGLVCRLTAFQDGDGSCDGSGDDPGGGRAVDAFTLERQSVQPVAVDTAVGVALGAHAAAPQVFDLGVAQAGEVGDDDPAGHPQQAFELADVVVGDLLQPPLPVDLRLRNVT